MVYAKTLSIISVCKFIVYVSNIFLLLIHRLDMEVTPGIGEQYCMVDLITGEIWGNRQHNPAVNWQRIIENKSKTKLSGGRFNIKMLSYQYRYPHVKDKTVSWLSYL